MIISSAISNRQVIAKLGNMRKPQQFIVYPRKNGENITIQSDKSIASFDPHTGLGYLNTKGSYFMHLHPALGAVSYTFPHDLVALCRKIDENQ
jgi:hypothetical protein